MRYYCCKQPSKKGEFRVFNQFTDFCSLNEIAQKIKDYADKKNIKTNITKVKNPRIEQEEYYYNPKNTSLISLGLNPISFDENEIDKIYSIVKKEEANINQDTFDPKFSGKLN